MTPNDATIWGLHYVEWREVDEMPPSEAIWERNKTCPRHNEKRWANIQIWHRTLLGERVWLLYQPGWSFFNGWNEHIAELEDSAIIECEIISRHQPEWHRKTDNDFRAANPDVVAAMRELETQGAIFMRPPEDEYRGWAEGICHRVVPLRDIPKHFLPMPCEQTLPNCDEKHIVWAESDSLIYVLRPYQEASEWWVATKSTPQRIVLYCFEVSLDSFTICNAEIQGR